MAWPINPRPAKSLVVLRDQYNAKYPKRGKASDGMLGDEAHAARQSDHNPDKNGVVRALDITHDPEHGLDISAEAHRLVDSGDPRIYYVIANGRIWGWPKKQWYDYDGTDKHFNHMHISVNTSNGDDTTPWKIDPERSKDVMTDAQIDRTIAAAYMNIEGVKPTQDQWDLHRKQLREQGAAWVPEFLEGFKGDAVAWKKYERNLKDAGKMLSENPDAKKITEIKRVLERR
jgi:hypothetical protein